MSNGSYSSLKSMVKAVDRKDEDNDDEASKSNNNRLLEPEEDDDFNCQTPTSDDHKIHPLRSPPPAPHKLLRKRRRSSEEGPKVEFFEKTRREEVNAFFKLFTIRFSSSSTRKRRSHSI